MKPFILNDSILVLPAPVAVLGPAERSEVDVPIRGPLGGAGVRVRRAGHTPSGGIGCFRHFLEPLPGAAPAILNRAALFSPTLLRAGDELLLGGVSLRLREPCPESGSPMVEFVGGTGAIRLDGRRDFYRAILLGGSIRLASELPTHLGVPGISPDAVCLQVEQEQLVFRSVNVRSVFAGAPRAAGICRWESPVPTDVYVQPLGLDPDLRRQVARLSVRPA